MTEIKTCRSCKYYKDYDGVFDWISSRIFGFPTLQKCFHPNRKKIIDYVNGRVNPITEIHLTINTLEQGKQKF